LAPQGVDVAEAVGSVSNGDSEMSEDDARIMGVPRDTAAGDRLGQPVCQPSAIGELAQQRVARVRDKIAASVVTSTRRTERLLRTFKEAFYADIGSLMPLSDE